MCLSGKIIIFENLEFTDDSESFTSKYEMKNILGQGASSFVVRVVERNTGLQFAAKVINLSIERQNEDKCSNPSEISMLKKCEAIKHLINIHDSIQSDNYSYIILKLCDHGTLFDYYVRHTTVSQKQTRLFMKQILTAVSHMHSIGIIHRDLKLENVLMENDQSIYVSDLGFAKSLLPNERLFDSCGTIIYMAPELLRCSMDDNPLGYGREADLWACGVMCFMLLFGHPPFNSEPFSVPNSPHRTRRSRSNPQINLIGRIIDGNYIIPNNAEIQDTTRDFIVKLLTVDPQQRMTAAQALAHPFLESYLKNSRGIKHTGSFRMKRTGHNSWKTNQSVTFVDLTNIIL